MKDWFGDGSPAQRKDEPKETPKDEPGINVPLAFQLKDVNPKHPYLSERGISEATATEFGVGFFPGKGSMAGRVVIPIHNERGDLVAYAGRALNGAEPKYLFPPKFRKSLEVYNLHRIEGEGEIVLVEGFFGCLALSQHGYAAVASMGSTLSDAQSALLARFSSVIVLYDADEAGRNGAGEAAAKLVHATFVKIVACPEGRQPDQLSVDELSALLG